MKLIILSILVVSYVAFCEAIVDSKAICAIELVTNAIKCIKRCRKDSRCSTLMNHCQKIKRAFLRRICKGVLKCGCPSCLLCLAKCIVHKFMKHNICNVGQYLKAITTLLGIKHHFDMTKKEEQTEAMKEVLDKVVTKNNTDEEDEEEIEYEEDDASLPGDEEEEDNEDDEEEEEDEISSQPEPSQSEDKKEGEPKAPLVIEEQEEDIDYYDDYDEDK